MLNQQHVRAELPSQHMTDEVSAQQTASTRPGSFPGQSGTNQIFFFQGLNTFLKKYPRAGVVSVTSIFVVQTEHQGQALTYSLEKEKKNLFKVEQIELFKTWQLCAQSKIRFLLKAQ